MINSSEYNINSLSIVHEKICAYFQVDYLYPFKKTTEKGVVYVRQIFHYISKNICNKNISTYKYIANYLGDIIKPLNHATVINSCKKIENYLTYDKQVQKDVDSILKMINKTN